MINFLLLLSASTIADFKPGKTQHSCPKMAKTSLDGKERTGSLLHFLTRVIMTIFVVTRSVLLICSPITLTRFVLSPSPLRSRGCQFFLHPFFPIYLFPSQFNFLLQIFLSLSFQFRHLFNTSNTIEFSMYFFNFRNIVHIDPVIFPMK